MNDIYNKKKFLYGPIAGIFESIFIQPFDTIKVLKQSNQYTSLKHIIINDPKKLYKGFTPFTTQMFVKYFLRFTTFDLFKSDSSKFSNNFFAGMMAGLTESIFITPFELIKTQLQTSEQKKSTILIKNIYINKGIKGLYRGFLTTSIRQSTNQGINFSLYYYLRKIYIKDNEKPNILKIFSIALLSSSIGPIITSPIDTIKTRFMNTNYNYNTLFDSINDIKKKDGLKGFFKGLEYRLLRVCGGQMITFFIIENLQYYL